MRKWLQREARGGDRELPSLPGSRSGQFAACVQALPVPRRGGNEAPQRAAYCRHGANRLPLRSRGIARSAEVLTHRLEGFPPALVENRVLDALEHEAVVILQLIADQPPAIDLL